MGMAKYTRGPWQVVAERRAEHRWVIGTTDESSVAACNPAGPWISGDEADANASLIASAPELLEAAESLIDAIAHVPGIEPERAALIAACVKAHGGTK